ncbi:hypothetical protein SESBI_24805 [Sesbania bispinosa]|nr:hypothetical protein SESBI_24805 [Sesbania bispinosa]
MGGRGNDALTATELDILKKDVQSLSDKVVTAGNYHNVKDNDKERKPADAMGEDNVVRNVNGAKNDNGVKGVKLDEDIRDMKTMRNVNDKVITSTGGIKEQQPLISDVNATHNKKKVRPSSSVDTKKKGRTWGSSMSDLKPIQPSGRVNFASPKGIWLNMVVFLFIISFPTSIWWISMTTGVLTRVHPSAGGMSYNALRDEVIKREV